MIGLFKKERRLSFGREELNRVLERANFVPKDLVALFEIDFGKDFAKDAGVWEKYSLKKHTLMVMEQFEKYFSKRELPGGVDTNFFRVFLALHDIGKPKAIKAGNKHMQHKYTIEIIRPVLSELGFNKRDVNIAVTLVSKDPIGQYLRQGEGRITTGTIESMAREAELPVDIFLELLLVFYKVDAGSYTENAGGKRSLDRLFVFDKKKNEMKFAPDTAAKIDQLRTSVSGRPGSRWVTDYDWHNIPYNYLKDWTKSRKEELDSGKILRGAVFRYRRNLKTGKYQVRLRRDMKESIYAP